MDVIKKQKENYDTLNSHLNKALKHLTTIFRKLNAKGCDLALSTNYDGRDYFKFVEHPELREAVKKLQKEFGKEVLSLLRVGITSEWRNANNAVSKIESNYNTQSLMAVNSAIAQMNQSAMIAFATRRENGMGLSDKIWKQSSEYISALENCISVAVHKGTPARELAKQVEEYLVKPEELHKDNVMEFGTSIKKNDIMYKTMRLARSEINMAYRTAEQLRWQSADYVLGYEIQLSNNHGCKGVKKGHYHDVCDDLAGRYPKDFVWKGWHPNCRCFSTPILLTPEEFIKYQNGELNIADKMIKDVPHNFKEWIRNNEDRIERAVNKPYFIQDNEKYINATLSTQNEIKVPKTQNNELTTLEKAKARHESRTAEDIANIQKRWNERKERNELILKTANNVLRVAKDYGEADYEELNKLIQEGNIQNIQAETKSLAKKIANIKIEEKKLSSLIPNIHELHKTRTLNELRKSYSKIKTRLLAIDKEVSTSSISLRDKYNLLNFESKHTNDDIVKTAYKHQIDIVKKAIEKQDFENLVREALTYSDSSKNRALKTIAKEVRSIISNDNFDIKIANQKGEVLINKYNQATKDHLIKESLTLANIEERLGKNTPKTLKYLDKVIDEEKSRRNVDKRIIENMKLFTKALFDNSDFGMNIPLYDTNGNNVIDEIFKTYFKSQIETATGKGLVDIETRKKTSEKLFGTPKSTTDIEYEKYGFLMEKDMLKQASSGVAGQYWSNGKGMQVRFKKDKVIATFTAGDSLDGNAMIPSLTTDPQITSFERFDCDYFKIGIKTKSAIKAAHIFSPYIELQYHGMLTLDCIESIFIPQAVYRSISNKTHSKIKELGIKIFTEENGTLKQLN